MYSRTLLLVSILGALSGCIIGPTYQGAAIALEPGYADASSKARPVRPDTAWWTSFRDPSLDRLVDAGLEQNLDILQAVERINKARANVVVAGAGARPVVSASNTGSLAGERGSRLGTPVDTTTITGTPVLNVSWLIDLFGGYQRRTEAAEASLDAVYVGVDTARLTLISNVATQYVNARLYQTQAAITRDTIASRRTTLQLTRELETAGSGTDLQTAQAEGLLRTAESTLPPYEVSFEQSAYQIAYLLGQQPTSVLAALRRGGPIPRPRFDTSAGVPADLLRNRPDVRAAERTLASAVADIGGAAANLYPSLSLTGKVGVSAANQISTASTDLLDWSFGPSLTIPIFNGGQLRAQVAIEQSEARGQYLTWRASVLNAAREVQSALSAYREQGRRIAALRRSVAAYRLALETSLVSYRTGLSSFLDVQESERSYADARLNLASAEAVRATYFITLNVAAGGGYAVGPSRDLQIAGAAALVEPVPLPRLRDRE